MTRIHFDDVCHPSPVSVFTMTAVVRQLRENLLDASKFMVPPAQWKAQLSQIENGDNGVFRLLPFENKAETYVRPLDDITRSEKLLHVYSGNERNSFPSIHLSRRPSCRTERKYKVASGRRIKRILAALKRRVIRYFIYIRSSLDSARPFRRAVNLCTYERLGLIPTIFSISPQLAPRNKERQKTEWG